MRRIILAATLCLLASAASAQIVGGPRPACSTFGTTSGTCIQGAGAGGMPLSLTLTNATGLPVSTGISGLGTGVATLLAGASSGTGGPAGTTNATFTGSTSVQTGGQFGNINSGTAANTAYFSMGRDNAVTGDFVLCNQGAAPCIHYTTGGNTTLPGTLSFLGTVPTPTGTGSPTMTAGSTDSAGEVTGGTSATSIIITFASTKSTAPFCTVTPQTQILAFAYTISTTAITITQTATTGQKIDYICAQH